jgi:hypothetical protein
MYRSWRPSAPGNRQVSLRQFNVLDVLHGLDSGLRRTEYIVFYSWGRDAKPRWPSWYSGQQGQAFSANPVLAHPIHHKRRVVFEYQNVDREKY